MSFTKPRAVLFDWDNTLVDTWPVIHAALEDTMVAFGQEPWSLDRVKRDVKKSMRDSFPELFGDRWQAAGEHYLKSYRARHLEALEPLPGAAEVLRRLQGQGIHLAVVSNKKGPTLRIEAEHLGWTPLFDALVGSDDAEFDKPHCAPVTLALHETGIGPAPDVWFIGDSDIDLHCAEDAGCTGFLYGPVTPEEKNSYGGRHFHRHLRSHVETLALLDEVLN